MRISLNGAWKIGNERIYDRVIEVPGLAGDPKEPNCGTLWYKRDIVLPKGEWSHATLLLKGARFCPDVYLNGEWVSHAAGGMACTTHRLPGGMLQPGTVLTLEIALKSLNDISSLDASYIPQADHWRSNVSSCLWDDVELNLHGHARISRVIASGDVENDEVTVRWETEVHTSEAQNDQISVQVRLENGDGQAVAEGTSTGTACGSMALKLNGSCRLWSPDDPACYRLKVLLMLNNKASDEEEMTFGLKQFKVVGKGFELNRYPVTFRSGTVVWHRWTRDPEASGLAFDRDWFEHNIIRRLKSHGANGLRFHLGNPPEQLLDLCDQLGLMVQLEWHFFHGMTASKESLVEQWKNWLDRSQRHPCICIIHPWNETEGEELNTAYAAISELASDYPPLVFSHRDVLHIHKYWWSMFENVGLYYDSADEFPQPIVADEFGGNYLDGDGSPGEYPMLRESFLRFLGKNHTREQRLQLHAESNTQIAEYWRRVGAAGFSPFCALGSPEDGNHHFLGRLKDGRPKEVWAGLTAAYSPLSCSLEVWNRNEEPGAAVKLPLHFFNETADPVVLTALVSIFTEEDHSEVHEPVTVICPLEPFSTEVRTVELLLPGIEGEWRYEAVLINEVPGVKHSIVSSWRFRTLTVKTSSVLQQAMIAVPEAETELRAFLIDQGLMVCELEDAAADAVLVSAVTWRALSLNRNLRDTLAVLIDKGCSVVMTGIGPQKLGQGYLENGELGPLQGQPVVDEPDKQEIELFKGIKLLFREVPEPESCLHPAVGNTSLWQHLPQQSTWLWNGLRGGLIVPAYDMEPTGLGRAAFLSLWEGRGADLQELAKGNYFAYELAGFYAFSSGWSQETSQVLRDKVIQLVEDAPALQVAINPQAKINVTNLTENCESIMEGGAESLTTLAQCGKNLARSPVVLIQFGSGKGKLLLSQTITNGRLAEAFGEPGLYGIRRDPAACQFVLNMLESSLSDWNR
jgi:hypothetical protein